MHIVIVMSVAFVFECSLALCFIELLIFYCKMYSMFYVTEVPEGKFLYTETIKLYKVEHDCILFQNSRLRNSRGALFDGA